MLEITRVAVGNASILCGCDAVSPYSAVAAAVDNSTSNLLMSLRVVSGSLSFRIEIGQRSTERNNVNA